MSETAELPYSIFAKDGTSKLWVRFSIKGEGQVRKSLGTSDPELAQRKAHEVWFEANYRGSSVAAEFVLCVGAPLKRRGARYEAVADIGSSAF